jgi:hypothetical protein
MSSNLSQNSGPGETLETSESRILSQVLGKNRMMQVRREIGLIADRSYRENLISDEAYEGYRELAEGREDQEVGAEMLESTRAFAKEHESKAIRIHQRIQAAIKAGIASETDEEFLMEKLVVDNIQFANKADEIEGVIGEKLARMKKDRKKYDKFAEHDLIRDIGYLTVDANTKIGFPNAEEYLAMTVPERRELLQKLEEALPKAEAYARRHENKENTELIAGYQEKLNGALEEGIIGKHTYDKFLNGFRKIDNEEKVYWAEEFDAQMERYRELWGNIRSTLQGEALDSIEGKRDTCGYTKLFAEFGRLKSSESERLGDSYAGELEKYRQEGIIGHHTVSQFVLWMNQQDLSKNYEAERQLPEQMVRYQKLWEDVDKLSAKQQEFMRSKIDIWGYTELSQQYQQFNSGGGLDKAAGDDADLDSLSQLRSKEVKDAIIETDEMLTAQGKGKKRAFMGVLDKMFNRVSRDKFDATSFEAELRAKVANDNGTKQITKGREANDEVNFHQIEKDTATLEEAGDAKITENLGFIQVESKEGERTAQVTINEEEGMKRFFTEDGKHKYRSEEEGGSDDLSLAIHTDSGRTVELDLQEIQALQKHLKKNEEERLDEAT